MMIYQWPKSHQIFKRLAKALIRLHVCAGWSEPLLVAHMTLLEVRKRAKILNRYNQATHLTQDTNGKVTTSQLDIANESQEVNTFPAGDHQASTNRRARKHNKTRQKSHK